MRKPSLSDIKYTHEKKGGTFFASGSSMKDFKVKMNLIGGVYVLNSRNGEICHFNQLTGDLNPASIKWDDIPVRINPARKLLSALFTLLKAKKKESACAACIHADAAEENV
jgi:hypothetical protein